MRSLQVLYFASLRDAAGCERQCVQSDAPTLAALYAQLQAQHGFALPVQRLRVAVDGVFANWADAPKQGSEVVFIPPVSGG